MCVWFAREVVKREIYESVGREKNVINRVYLIYCLEEKKNLRNKKERTLACLFAGVQRLKKTWPDIFSSLSPIFRHNQTRDMLIFSSISLSFFSYTKHCKTAGAY